MTYYTDEYVLLLLLAHSRRLMRVDQLRPACLTSIPEAGPTPASFTEVVTKMKDFQMPALARLPNIIGLGALTCGCGSPQIHHQWARHTQQSFHCWFPMHSPYGTPSSNEHQGRWRLYSKVLPSKLSPLRAREYPSLFSDGPPNLQSSPTFREGSSVPCGLSTAGARHPS